VRLLVQSATDSYLISGADVPATISNDWWAMCQASV
jgi:hypothetical protein